MEITEVRIKLMDDPQERLQAFCSLTFDHSFVIRDLKIIEGIKGSFVAMPSRKLTDRCPQCGSKNHLRAQFCNQCGVRLREDRATKDIDGRAKLYADIAHPINSRCRELIQARVLQAFQDEQIRAQQPGYVCTYDDFGEEGFAEIDEEPLVSTPPVVVRQSGAIHRIETAHGMEAASRVGSPHHASHSAASERSDASDPLAHSGNRRRAHGDGEPEEGFGAGIL